MENNIFNILSIASFALAALFLILAVVLFFGLGVGNVYGELHGRPAKSRKRSSPGIKTESAMSPSEANTAVNADVSEEAPTILETGEIADSSLIDVYEEHTVAEFMDGITEAEDSETLATDDFTSDFTEDETALTKNEDNEDERTLSEDNAATAAGIRFAEWVASYDNDEELGTVNEEDEPDGEKLIANGFVLKKSIILCNVNDAIE